MRFGRTALTWLTTKTWRRLRVLGGKGGPAVGAGPKELMITPSPTSTSPAQIVASNSHGMPARVTLTWLTTRMWRRLRVLKGRGGGRAARHPELVTALTPLTPLPSANPVQPGGGVTSRVVAALLSARRGLKSRGFGPTISDGWGFTVSWYVYIYVYMYMFRYR